MPQTPTNEPRCALTIAGSDSGGGAGIQADLKTFAAHRVHGLSAIAALTAQNTRAVTGVHTPPAAFLRLQIDALAEDFRIGAVKIGMLASGEVIEAVAAAIEHHALRPVVLDPVMIASSGASLLAPDALHALRTRLLPLAQVLTPNLPEAAALLGHPIQDRHDMMDAAHALLALGADAVLLKGGHLPQGDVMDVYVDATGQHEFRHERLPVEGHGTGCTLASAVAAQLARGVDTLESCRRACDYVHGALRHAAHPGRGTVAVLDHFWQVAAR